LSDFLTISLIVLILSMESHLLEVEIHLLVIVFIMSLWILIYLHFCVSNTLKCYWIQI